MYLHLGQDKMLQNREIIGIFDLDSTSLGKATRSFLSAAQRAGRVETIGEDLPKSYVLTSHKKIWKLIIGPLNTLALRSRVRTPLK